MKMMKLNIQLFAASASISCSQVGEPNIAGNYTTQRLTFTVKRTSGTTYWATAKALIFSVTYLTDSGTATKTASTTLAFPSGSVGATASAYADIEIPHKSDGSQYITFSASIATGTSAGTLNPSGSATLYTIPRTSSFSATNAAIGGSSSISISRASSSFTHNVLYSFGSLSGTALSGTGTGGNWTIPSSFYTQIPNSKTGTCTLTCITYSGSTEIGRTSKTITISTSESLCKPSVSGSVVDTNSATIALTGNSSKLVKYKSTAKITASASAKNSASITKTTIDGLTTNPLTIANISKNSFALSTTDSRGYTGSGTASAIMVDYVNLTCKPVFKRTTQTGSEVKLSYTGNYFNGNFGAADNELTMSWAWREKGSTEWIDGGTLEPTISGNIYSGEIVCGTDYDYKKNYEFIVYFADKLNDLNSGAIPLLKGQGSLEVYKDGIKINGVFIGLEVVEEW